MRRGLERLQHETKRPRGTRPRAAALAVEADALGGVVQRRHVAKPMLPGRLGHGSQIRQGGGEQGPARWDGTRGVDPFGGCSALGAVRCSAVQCSAGAGL